MADPTIQVMISARGSIPVPVLQQRGEWALHGNVKPKRLKYAIDQHRFAVTHIPSGRAVLYHADQKTAEAILAFAAEVVAPGSDPNECPQLLRAARIAQEGRLAV